MTHAPFPSGGLALHSRHRRGRSYLALTAVAATLAGVALVGRSVRHEAPPAADAVRVAAVGSEPAPAPAQEAMATPTPAGFDWLLDPAPSLGPDAPKAWPSGPLASAFRLASVQAVGTAAPLMPPTDQNLAATPHSAPAEDAIPLVQAVPLPAPRPSELLDPTTLQPPRLADRRAWRRTKTAALQAPAAPVDNRSFLEKLFGVQPSSGPSLAYASLGSGTLDMAPDRRLTPVPSAGSGIAVYDISARVVHMPNGEVLEAHSGLGDRLDDARYVQVRMRGPTPPGTYDLTEREQLFHGVRALRLNPVGGNGAVYGRAGLLAHTYMLGANGDSNGCVSFKDYDKFLQAYLRGEVKRLIVVTGRGQNGPGIATRRFGRNGRSGPRGDDA